MLLSSMMGSHIQAGPFLILRMRSNVYLTASAVTGEPSWNLRVRREA